MDEYVSPYTKGHVGNSAILLDTTNLYNLPLATQLEIPCKPWGQVLH